MNYQEPYKTSNIDLNKIVYPKIKANQNKKIILLKYNDKGKLRNLAFQTPTLLNPHKPNHSKAYSELELALIGKEQNKVENFTIFLNNLEKKIKTDAQFNSSKWFDISESNDTINFQRIIRDSEDFKEGTIKVKLIKNDDFETVVQLNNSKRISFDDIPEDSWCKMILECYAIWINSSNDFGIFLRPILVSFTPREKQIYNYKFVEDSEDEDNIFEVPDTDASNNVFMKIEQTNKKVRNIADSTSQLDLNELVKHLESEDQLRSSEIGLTLVNSNTVQPETKVITIEPLLDINLHNRYDSSSDSENTSSTSSCTSENESDYDSDSENESSNTQNIDAETSDVM